MSIKHCQKFLQTKMLGFIYWKRVQRPLFPSFQSNQLENNVKLKCLPRQAEKLLSLDYFPKIMVRSVLELGRNDESMAAGL